MFDNDDNRLEVAKEFGATQVINGYDTFGNAIKE
jgi:threonine dehydrogenase-like Zn-dependent dehydrogenase